MRAPASMATLSQPALLLAAGRAVGCAAAFAVPLVLARVLTQAEFGSYKQAFLIFGTLFGLAQLGMAESLYYFIPRSSRDAGRLIANSLVALAVAGLGCLALLVAFGARIARWLSNPELTELMVPLGLLVTLMLVSALLEIVMVSRKQHRAAALAYAGSDIVRTLCLIVSAVAFGTVYGIVIGAVLLAALRVGAMLVWLWREFGSELRLDIAVGVQQLAYALPFALAVGIEVVQINYHQYVVASHFDAAIFAIYAVGCTQIPVVDLITSSVGNVMMVRMAEDTSAGQRHAALSLWHQSVSQLALLIFPLVVFLLVAAREIILTLYTAAYVASVPIFMLWSLVLLPSVFAIDSVLRVHAQTRFLLWMNVVRLTLVAVSIGWFLSVFGLYGAVLVTLVSTVLVRGAGIVRMARLLGVSVSEVLPWSRLAGIALVAIVAAAPAYWVTREIVLAPFAALLASAAVYGTAYLVLCSAGFLLYRTEEICVALPES
jgi:O-antigen/teichoic acid export membrane protein